MSIDMKSKIDGTFEKCEKLAAKGQGSDKIMHWIYTGVAGIMGVVIILGVWSGVNITELSGGNTIITAVWPYAGLIVVAGFIIALLAASFKTS